MTHERYDKILEVANGMSRAQLKSVAESAGCSLRTVYRWRRGRPCYYAAAIENAILSLKNNQHANSATTNHHGARYADSDAPPYLVGKRQIE